MESNFNSTELKMNASASNPMELNPMESDLDSTVCKPGLILPVWETNDDAASVVFHGIVYFLALAYSFVGVSIVADRFMAAIETITSQERDVIVRKPSGEKEIISVRIWNETVSNLTLMALGSSAPEILLSIIEIYGNNFKAGDLGPGTIVGSAAFNMFVIIAICVYCVPSPEAKKIKHLRVFCVTMVFSLLAYIWLLFILSWSSEGIIEVWEGLLTFAFFPATVLVAYIADRRLLIYKYLSKKYRVKSRVIYGGAQADNEDVELNAIDAIEKSNKNGINGVDVKGDVKFIDASADDIRQIEDDREEAIEILRDLKVKNPGASNEDLEKMAREELYRIKPKSRAYYRVQVAKKLVGRAKDSIKNQITRSISDYKDEEDDKDVVNIYFNPSQYTVMENVGHFQVTISRTGDLDHTVNVDYSTEDGTAKAGSDYKPVSGTVIFGPGEAHKQITIEIINDDVFEEDEHFFITLTGTRYLGSPDVKRPELQIAEPSAKIIILDDDHSGIFSFNTPVIQVPESIGEYRLKVSRFCGARGQVSLPYRTIPASAKDGEDFVMTEGKLLFHNNEASQEIPINIINKDSYEKNVAFFVEIGDPKREGGNDDDDGAPRLGELVKCMIRIRESKEFKTTVDKLIKNVRVVSAISTSSWEEQFLEAITVPDLGAIPEDGEEEADAEVNVHVVKKKSLISYVFHYLTLFWKILFAFIPPPNYYNGWACFTVSIIVIGLLTALIGDLASHFGCTVHLKDSVTAISFVALGTSVPDTFASKVAAMNDKHADSSIGNVTGSNAVNVFLGIGIAWTMAAIYHFYHGEVFEVNPGSLAFSVTLFCITAILCSGVLLLRRSSFVGGELGGPMKYKLPTTILFVFFWLFYVIMSSLEAYGIVEGF